MNRIVYFSAGGETRNFAEILKSILEKDRFFKISDIGSDISFCESDITIFLCPVFNGRIAKPMRKFLSSSCGRGSRAVFVCAFGGVFKGQSVPDAMRLLEKRGFVPDGGAAVHLHHTYLPQIEFMPSVSYDAEAVIRFAESIWNGSLSFKIMKKYHTSRLVFGRLLGTAIGKLTCRTVKNTSLCGGCGICRTVCPTDAVHNDFTVDNKLCIRCGACVKACPQGALAFRFYFPHTKAFIRKSAQKKKETVFYIREKAKIYRVIFQ